MKIYQAEINQKRNRGFSINRKNSDFYYIQLFHTATRFVLNGKEIITPKNTLIAFSTESKQNFETVEDTLQNSYVQFYAKKSELKNLVFDTPIPLKNPQIVHGILSLIQQERALKQNGDSVVLHALMKALIRKIGIEYGNMRNDRSDEQQIYTLYEAHERIRTKPGNPICIKDLAKACNMSLSYFQHQYKKLFGISPTKDLIERRIAFSRDILIQTDSTIQIVAENCGYHNVEHFIRQFKKKMGVSPMEYRKQQKEKKQ